MIDNICVICGTGFTSNKKPTMSCSTKCRNRKHRIDTNPKRIADSYILYPNGSDTKMYIQCEICGLRAGEISCHVLKEHGISSSDYKLKYKLSTLKCQHLCESVKGANNPRSTDRHDILIDYSIPRKIIKVKSDEPYLLDGVGYNDNKYQTNINGQNVTEYIIWRAMIVRCYNKESFIDHPTYKDCTVSDNFLSYSYFYEWCHKQIGFNNDGWHLDKDILVKGNKIYSEDMCCFIPHQINTTIKSRPNIGKILPTGVYKNGDRFQARLGVDNSEISLGYFDTSYEASIAYKNAKENRIGELAKKYKDVLDEKVYKTLLEYEHIED